MIRDPRCAVRFTQFQEVEDVRGDDDDQPNLELTDRMLAQGKALVRAITALGAIEPDGWFERATAGLLLSAYKQRLRGIVEAAPEWMAEEILSASQHIEGDRAVPWSSEN